MVDDMHVHVAGNAWLQAYSQFHHCFANIINSLMTWKLTHTSNNVCVCNTTGMHDSLIKVALLQTAYKSVETVSKVRWAVQYTLLVN